MAIGPPGDMKRLLILTYYVPPSSAVAVYRMLGFARHLPAFGWRVGFVAPPQVPGEPEDNALLSRLPPGTPLFHAPYPRSLPARAAKRFCHHAIWLPRGLRQTMRAIGEFQPDAILTSGPPHCVHFLGMLLKRMYRLPWAACLRDPWFTCASYGYSLFPWARWERYWERRMMQQADLVLANTPYGFHALAHAHPGQQHKTIVLTNGFDPESFATFREQAQPNERFTILHAGELYGGRNPRGFFEAMRALDDHRPPGTLPLRVRLLGQATEKRLDPQVAIRELNLGHIVEFGGQVPYASALEAMCRADVLLMILPPGRTISIPAKLFEYMGAGRPVLALAEPDSDAAWALRASGTPHRVVSPLDVAGIQRAVIELRDGLAQKTLVSAPAEQLAAFTRARLAGQLAKHLDGLVAVEQDEPAPTNGHCPAIPLTSTQGALERQSATSAPGGPHYARA